MGLSSREGRGELRRAPGGKGAGVMPWRGRRGEQGPKQGRMADSMSRPYSHPAALLSHSPLPIPLALPPSLPPSPRSLSLSLLCTSPLRPPLLCVRHEQVQTCVATSERPGPGLPEAAGPGLTERAAPLDNAPASARTPHPPPPPFPLTSPPPYHPKQLLFVVREHMYRRGQFRQQTQERAVGSDECGTGGRGGARV